MTKDSKSKDGIEGTRQDNQDVSEESRRDFLSGVLASSAALAGLGLVAEALGSSKAEGAEPPSQRLTSLRDSPVRLRSLKNGISLEVSSKELAKHLINEGIADPKHRQGVATVRYDLVIG